MNDSVAGTGWLARSWRPITMLVFVALIAARWLGYARSDLSESEVLALWSVVQYAMTGYVIGRSVEKVAPVIASAVSK